MSNIKGQVTDFSLYNGSNRLIGHGSEITLPTIAFIKYAAELAAGNMDLPGMRTENIEVEVPFNVFDREAGSIISLSKTTTLIARGALQGVDTGSHNFDYSGVKVTMKGFASEVNLGTLKRSDKMDSNVKLTLSYIKIEDSNGNVYIEIDKLNGTLIINGEDVRRPMQQYL